MTNFAVRPLDSFAAEKLRKTPDPVVYIADESPGYPCRECLRDAEIGEELILVSHDPFTKGSPYRSSSPIFIHRSSCQNNIDRTEIPEQLRRRQLSVRAFDHDEMMTDGQVIEGQELRAHLTSLFERNDTSYVDVHNASRGCWAARVERVGGEPE
jgi:Protein of unknown function (DUF1203)